MTKHLIKHREPCWFTVYNKTNKMVINNNFTSVLEQMKSTTDILLEVHNRCLIMGDAISGYIETNWGILFQVI